MYSLWRNTPSTHLNRDDLHFCPNAYCETWKLCLESKSIEYKCHTFLTHCSLIKSQGKFAVSKEGFPARKNIQKIKFPSWNWKKANKQTSNTHSRASTQIRMTSNIIPFFFWKCSLLWRNKTFPRGCWCSFSSLCHAGKYVDIYFKC